MAQLNPDHLRAIIRMTTTQMGMWSPEVEELLLGTAAHESHLGKYLKQIKGPALGIYQMEPATERDIWENYLSFRLDRWKMIAQLTGNPGPDPNHLQFNLIYQTAMARLHYRRVREAIPAGVDIEAQARYWDQHYNRNPAKGFPAQYIEDYRRLVQSR